MYVIADIEWVTSRNGIISPVQLAAIRVDENWGRINSYYTFIKPTDNTFNNWKHSACNGGVKRDFLLARTAAEVFSDFRRWLNGDTLLWWLDGSRELFSRLTVELLGSIEPSNAQSISGYVQAFLKGQPYARSNIYTLAGNKGVIVKREHKHCSDNDARVIQELMQKIEFPQSELMKPISALDINKTPLSCRYIYDTSANTIHLNGCDNISDGETIGYPNFATALRKGYKACRCCKSEYLAALRARNLDIISRVNYNYLYAENSKVFHSRTCPTILAAKLLKGSACYNTAVKSGRTPCRLCKPVPIKTNQPPKSPQKTKQTAFPKKNSKSVNKAIRRLDIARKERNERLNNNLSKTERKDIMTLTDPRFSFWSGYGYNNFHLRTCPKLKGLSKLHGYRLYREAIQFGHTPCKLCKPTAKHDAIFSIPITSRKRDCESIERLEEMCQNSGFLYHSDREYFYLQTHIGKWKIVLGTNPVRLLHFSTWVDNDAEEYHVQPRVFLSLTDAFLYIKRHDERQNVNCFSE